MVGGGSGGGGGAGSQRRQGTLARPARHSARGHSLVQLGPAPGADKEAVLGVKLVELAGSRGLSALGEGGEGGGGGGGGQRRGARPAESQDGNMPGRHPHGVRGRAHGVGTAHPVAHAVNALGRARTAHPLAANPISITFWRNT